PAWPIADAAGSAILGDEAMGLLRQRVQHAHTLVGKSHLDARQHRLLASGEEAIGDEEGGYHGGRRAENREQRIESREERRGNTRAEVRGIRIGVAKASTPARAPPAGISDRYSLPLYSLFSAPRHATTIGVRSLR